MTIHCSRQWWSPQESLLGAANFLLFFSLSGSTIYHFISAIVQGPGFLTPGWTPVIITLAFPIRKKKHEHHFIFNYNIYFYLIIGKNRGYSILTILQRVQRLQGSKVASLQEM